MILCKFKLEDFLHSVNRNRMAGRASKQTSPNQPSQKSYPLILHFEVDVKRLVEEGKDYPWPRQKICPNPKCHSRRLWGHGYVLRYFEGFTHGLWMKRYRCPDCKAVHTCRIQQFYKGFHYSISSILFSLLNRIIDGKWLKCLSRQVQQYWYKGFSFQACRHRNCMDPDIEVLRELFHKVLIPVTHSFQCEILRL